MAQISKFLRIQNILLKGSIVLIFLFYCQFSCNLQADDKKPIIIFLNGTSSAGKSSIATQLLEQLHDPFLHVGIDWYVDIFNPRYLEYGESADKGYKFISTEDEKGSLTVVKKGSLAKQLDYAAHQAMKVFLDNKFNLILDEVLDDESFKDYLSLFHEYCVYFIAIKPPLEVAQYREANRGDRVHGLARGFYHEVYSNKIYDLEIDSSKLTPEESAQVIINFIQSNPNPTAFKSNIISIRRI